MALYQIVKKFWFDAGHRMYNHDILTDRGAKLVNKTSSELGWQRFKCANPHGHTFQVELFFESDSLDAQYVVIDTDKIKRVINEFMDKYDHAYILGKDDPLKEGLLKLFEGYRVVIIDAVPTAEAIAEEIYRFFDHRLKNLLPDEYPSTFKLVEVRLQMTSTLVAIYRP